MDCPQFFSTSFSPVHGQLAKSIFCDNSDKYYRMFFNLEIYLNTFSVISIFKVEIFYY